MCVHDGVVGKRIHEQVQSTHTHNETNHRQSVRSRQQTDSLARATNQTINRWCCCRNKHPHTRAHIHGRLQLTMTFLTAATVWLASASMGNFSPLSVLTVSFIVKVVVVVVVVLVVVPLQRSAQSLSLRSGSRSFCRRSNDDPTQPKRRSGHVCLLRGNRRRSSVPFASLPF